jgi:hypothetical protein
VANDVHPKDKLKLVITHYKSHLSVSIEARESGRILGVYGNTINMREWVITTMEENM